MTLEFHQIFSIPGNTRIILSTNTNSITVYRGIPDNRGIGTFFSIPVWRIYDNRGSDNRGPPVVQMMYIPILGKMQPLTVSQTALS